MIFLESVIKRAEELYGKDLPSRQITCLAQALVEATNYELTAIRDKILNEIYTKYSPPYNGPTYRG